MPSIRVVIVDDSAVQRALLREMIERDPAFEVVAMAPDPIAAREAIREHSPDVITLDVQMPRMDGLTFLERLMRLKPTPVVMVSSLTEAGADSTLRALELGAVDFMTKPRMDAGDNLRDYGDELREKLKAAAKAKLVPLTPAPAVASKPAAAVEKARSTRMRDLIAIGASTGGTEAIKEVLVRLPADLPPIVIVQHMPPGFTRSFAARLDGLCALSVSEAVHGEVLQSGHAYIAPGDQHLAIEKQGGRYVAVLKSTEKVNMHRPSVDVLFESVSQIAGRKAVGMILTGMGKDGAQGLLMMRNAGSPTLAQDEASCVVYGMPREAAVVGAAEEVVSLKSMADRLLDRL
ncbi:protein-glutamate methylesterase/protein-glutamine glutaminase [Parachitinimonas caeni]|uniref:Protein-glutamate methylesterase/protein-glutamine glutaminase n=1 Tax=Parachitinimonas caeni TaxID=3031301 RepID=A0ABT7DWE1_9NEIS|nr:chemotaxis response regulator protein-glutamate methylesterase [Parachitinimonas caeni]MDK2123428.1 chemotaxis response regulator protein-glutamate methylesterase [Parachitinimonas caeni]